MIKIKFVLVILITLILQLNSIQAQQYWTLTENTAISSKQLNDLKVYQIFQLDEERLKTQMNEAFSDTKKPSTKNIFSFPVQKNRSIDFELHPSIILEEGLAEKYPQVKTYKAIGVQDKRYKAHFDWTNSGLHGYIYTTESEFWIDPIADKQGLYVVYDTKNTEVNASHPCGTIAEELLLNLPKNSKTAIGEELRVLRAAFATTGEFAQQRVSGADANNPMEAVISMVNRLNLVLERDLSLSLILVENNDKIAFTDPETDPYSNEAFDMLRENIDILNDSIGFDNYDIGHVLTAEADGGVGGVAFLASICGDAKASGVSSFFSNESNFFGTLVHEVGHQLGGSHTWNRCGEDSRDQRSRNSAVEPGSGSTILSYAGLCGSDNVSSGFNFFHGFSIAQMNATIENRACFTTDLTGNTIPEVTIPYESGLAIPQRTPFELTAIGRDADGDALTYSWEQMDIGPSTPPEEPSGSAPSFKANAPLSSPTREFPKLRNLLFGVPSSGEVLPDYARRLTFSVVARDNNINSGGVAEDEFFIQVAPNADSFVVAFPNDGERIAKNQLAEIRWNVGGTNRSPVNCQAVDIMVAYNFGNLGFTDTLAKAVPNTGSAMVMMPDRLESRVRLKIKASDNVFFDISDGTFSLVEEVVNTENPLVENKIEVHPNPSTGWLYISSSQRANTALDFSFWNMQGQKLLERNDERTLQQSFDLSHLPKGVYFLRIANKEDIVLKKVILK
ncbi:MAG: reprolysin-like metallopeptidase [Bacteroidota bacterium]